MHIILFFLKFDIDIQVLAKNVSIKRSAFEQFYEMLRVKPPKYHSRPLLSVKI